MPQELKAALKFAMSEIHAIERIGMPAKVWNPLPGHAHGGHVHIVALAT
jgi:hypothetical protein